MALNGTQMTNQALQLGGLDRVRGEAFTEQQSVKAITDSGIANGVQFVVEENPMQELMDSMEELSFQFEEKEAKEVSERKLGAEKKVLSRYVVAVEKWQKTLPDLPNSAFMLSLLRRCRQAESQTSPQQLLKWLGGEGGSADPSHQLAMLECMAEAVGESEEGLKRLLAETKAELERTKGAAARAGINLAEAVNSRTTDAAKMQELRDLYRGEVIGFTTPQDCFRSLLASRGKGQLEAAIAFLIEGAGDDLNSPSPSQGKEELRRIILDLQCVEVLKTVLERMCRLAVRMEREFAEKSALDGEALTGRIMDFTEMEFMTPETVSGLVTMFLPMVKIIGSVSGANA